MNCFLNVCLQTLWQFPQVRFQIKQFAEQAEPGPEHLKPLIESIKRFYQEVTSQH
jgi:hypothetical protein